MLPGIEIRGRCSCPEYSKKNSTILDNTHFGRLIIASVLQQWISRMIDETYPHNPPIQYKTLLLRHENLTILLTLHLRLERRLVQIRIKHVPSLSGIKSLQPMLLQRLHQYGVRHLQSLVQIDQVLVAVRLANLLSRDSTKCAIQVVNAFDEITGEPGDGESFCGVDFAFGAVLEVAEVGH